MRAPRVHFICKQRNELYDPYNGGTYGLLNSAKFVANYLDKQGVETKVEQAVDSNQIDRLVTEYDPTHVMIEAIWVTGDKLVELLRMRRHQARTWVIRLHSKIPFIANEGVAFERLNQYHDVAKQYPQLMIAPNSEEFTNDLKDVLAIHTHYLPNIYCPPEYEYGKIHKRRKVLNIGCFGAIRPMKNQLIQAVAAIKYADNCGEKMMFHINGSRKEQRGDQVFKNLESLFAAQRDHLLVLHDWLPHCQFVQLVKQMDIGLQVSYTESFNIIAADFVHNGVPIITSSQIDWMPSTFQTDPNSSEGICKALAFTQSYVGKALRFWCNHNLKKWNDMAANRWVDFIRDH